MSRFSKCLWDSTEFNAMESCYKLYTWINDAILMLFVQFFWKMSQISDYFSDSSVIASQPAQVQTLIVTPLTKESKFRRHIRSMSDVQSSTPYYRITHRSRKGSNPILMYDSDSRARRYQHITYQEMDSSDSSDYLESVRKDRMVHRNILKHSDSMRVL